MPSRHGLRTHYDARHNRPWRAAASKYKGNAVNEAINIEDLRRIAKRRLPKIAYDFIEGGAEDEIGLDRNERSFQNLSIVPRYLIDVSKRDQATTLFGRAYASPVGIAPTGLAALFRPGADLMLAEASRRNMAGTSSTRRRTRRSPRT